jgi:hypothetical protein
MSGQYYEFKVVFCLCRKRDENDLHELVVEGVIIEPSPFDKLRTMQAQGAFFAFCVKDWLAYSYTFRMVY